DQSETRNLHSIDQGLIVNRKFIYNLCLPMIVINFSMNRLQKNKPYLYLFWIGTVAMLLGVFHSCQKIEFDTGSAVDIRFSTDTLTFDTVFTQVGSTTGFSKSTTTGIDLPGSMKSDSLRNHPYSGSMPMDTRAR